MKLAPEADLIFKTKKLLNQLIFVLDSSFRKNYHFRIFTKPTCVSERINGEPADCVGVKVNKQIRMDKS